MKQYINKLYKGSAVVAALATMTACTDSFLEQDPLSFYEPAATYTTESGLQSALTMCDKQLKTYILDGNWNNVGLASNYYLTDVGMYAKTDMGGGFQDDFDSKLTPTSGLATGGDGNYFKRFWNEGFDLVKYANSVISYTDKVEGLDEETLNAYLGRAYFHRAYAYYNLTLQFGDIPLITKLLEVPKQNYKSTSKEAIFQKLVVDLEFAVKWVPSQQDMDYIGMVNKEACLHLLTKCYLVTGQYDKAEQTASDLINNYGLKLMTESFGEWQPSGNEETWKVTRNVVWDLHRTPNICHAENKELIMPIINSNDQNFTTYNIMRANFAHWSNSVIRDPHGLSSPGSNYARNSSNYNPELDWVRVAGRGIALNRTSYFYNKTIWTYDGEMDWQDLRHNREVGNWMEMEDFKYNNPNSDFYGKNYQLYATENYVDPETDKVLVFAGDILCSDTIRSWYPTPLYQLYIKDEVAEAQLGANQFQGAQGKGCNGDMYLFRLADTYLLRAEAKFYQGNATGAAQDVNAVRARANAKKMYTSVTIGDIMAERARELYMEEFRQAEMVRVSWCLAKSGKPDEWGGTYDINTWDKQDGTTIDGKGSYWFKRCTTYNVFNRDCGKGSQGSQTFEYKVNKHNLFWPVPYSAIEANTKAQLRQNYGYDGYDENIPMFTNWEEAVADEDLID